MTQQGVRSKGKTHIPYFILPTPYKKGGKKIGLSARIPSLRVDGPIYLKNYG